MIIRTCYLIDKLMVIVKNIAYTGCFPCPCFSGTGRSIGYGSMSFISGYFYGIFVFFRYINNNCVILRRTVIVIRTYALIIVKMCITRTIIFIYLNAVACMYSAVRCRNDNIISARFKTRYINTTVSRC